MRSATIRAIAHAIPERQLTYAQLEERFGAKDVASIFKMSGIRNRRVVAPGQCASDLGLAAARRLLAHTGVDPRSIDLVTFASQTPDYRVPATAAVLHGKLGLGERCCALDIGQACSSFVHNLGVAQGMIAAGTATRALVINADALTTLVHPKDRGLVTLHGDGAAAALIEACDTAEGGIEFIEFGTDGTRYDRLLVPAGGAREPSSAESRVEVTDESGITRTREHLFMDGPAVFHFSIYTVTAFLKRVLADRKLTSADFDSVILHQANKTMVDMIYKSIAVPPEKRFYYLEDVGNSSGASLPSALAEAWRAGAVKPGSRTLACAFGGGLSWGAFAIRWPANADAAVPGNVEVAA